MIADCAGRCTCVYVLTDAAYQEVAAPYDQRPGPRSAVTDSELITLTIAAELLGLAAETRFLAYVRRNHATRFPRLPERSRYNRRRHQPVEVTNRIRINDFILSGRANTHKTRTMLESMTCTHPTPRAGRRLTVGHGRPRRLRRG